MIPSQGGREGYKGSPNPPSNGSEDNGFANRPRVAGLYTTNLFRQELIRSSEETGARSHGPARDILERSPREIGSQRSLNFPTGIAEEFELLDRSRIGISRTPQPLRRTEVAVGHYEPRSRFDESIRRGDHYGSSVERIRGREHEQQEGCIVPDTIRRSHAEFSEQTLWMESGIDNSKIPISTDDFAGRRGQDDSSTSLQLPPRYSFHLLAKQANAMRSRRRKWRSHHRHRTRVLVRLNTLSTCTKLVKHLRRYFQIIH
uniref:Na channel protein 60E n=1 Tax=Apis cerana TaxID=7461 RepID=V9ILU3_APICE